MSARSEERRERLRRIREAAVRVDSQPALLKAASKLRAQLPGDDRFGDPLSTAGDEVTHVVGRRVWELGAVRPSLSREVGLGALQIWQSLSEQAGRGRGDREVALLFTDLVGFSSWALDAGDEAALELLREVGIAVEGQIEQRRGTVVKRLGDGVMAAFSEVGDAVQAGIDAHLAVAEIEVAGHRPRLRAGVHVGRPRRIGGDYLGVDVNIAARVVDAAKAGETLVSTPACEALPDGAFDVGRAKRLRAPGAPKELRVCVVARAPSSEPAR